MELSVVKPHGRDLNFGSVDAGESLVLSVGGFEFMKPGTLVEKGGEKHAKRVFP